MNAKKREKVAIVGFATTSREESRKHMEDPEWDVWACNELGRFMPDTKFDRYFNIHWVDNELTPEAVEYLAGQETPVYMATTHPKISVAEEYPKEEVLKWMRYNFPICGNREYFTSSIAWMLGLAIVRGYKHISLYGVEMQLESEYAYQRPCCETLIGFACGKGIKVEIPRNCNLFKKYWLYGYEPAPTEEGVLKEEELMDMVKNHKECREALLAHFYRADGAFQFASGMHEHAQNGGGGKVEAKEIEEKVQAIIADREAKKEELCRADGALHTSEHLHELMRRRKREANLQLCEDIAK